MRKEQSYQMQNLMKHQKRTYFQKSYKSLGKSMQNKKLKKASTFISITILRCICNIQINSV